MNAPRAPQRGFPVEEFLHALTSQLDNAQDSLAIKVRAGRPLTWALKDLSIDLRVFVDMDPGGRVLLRSAAPNEEGASTLHLSLTTITRPMVEENTRSVLDDADPRRIDDLRATSSLDDNDRKRLEWMGIRTVGQLKQLSRDSNPKAMESMLGIPALRLQAALQAASRPAITGHDVVRRPDGRRLIRVQGANLSDGVPPEVRLAGEPVEVLDAQPHELLVQPLEHQREGQIEVLSAGQRATGFFRVPPDEDLSKGGAP